MAAFGDAALAPKSLIEAQLTLLLSDKADKYADATVTCQGVVWKVQTSVLCTRSIFFEKCFSDAMFQEAYAKTTDFKLDEPHVVEALLIYLYILEYPHRCLNRYKEPESREDTLSPGTGKCNKVGTARTTRSASRRASIDSSHGKGKKNAEFRPEEWTRFRLKSEAPRSRWQLPLGLCRLALRLDLKELYEMALGELAREIDKGNDIEGFVEEVYGMSDAQTPDLQVMVAAKLANDPTLLTQRCVERLIHSHPTFGFDLFKMMRVEMDWLRSHWDPS